MSIHKSLPTTSGIYSLMSGGDLLYIGQAKNSRHVGGEIKFDEVRYIPCPESELNDRERQAIKTNQPKLNKRHTGRGERRMHITSLSISKALLPKAKERAKETDRGNLSAYVERLIIADLSRRNEMEVA